MGDPSLDEMLLEAAGRKTGRNRYRSRTPAVKRRSTQSSDDDDTSSRSGTNQEDDEDDKGGRRNSSRYRIPVKKRLEVSEREEEDEKEAEEEDEVEGEGENGDGSESELSFGSDLYKDEDDRARLESMTELEREMLLMERGEKRDNFLMRRKKQEQERRHQKAFEELKKSARKKANHAVTMKVRTRGKISDAKKDALKELKALVENRKQDMLHDMHGKRRKVVKAPSGSSSSEEEIEDVDDDENEDVNVKVVDYRREDVKSREIVAEDNITLEPPTFEDVQGITIRRSKLAKWMTEPFFEDVIVGCFVRLGVETGYHLCQVRGVDAGDLSRMYKLANKMTHKYLNCAWGEKMYTTSMMRVSEQPPTAEEFSELAEEVERCGIELVSKSEIELKREAIGQISRYVYSAATVKRMLAEKKLTSWRPSNLAAEKDRVLRELALAEQEVAEPARVERLQEELRRLEARAEQQNRARDAKALALAEMNRKNRFENYLNASFRRGGAALRAGDAGYDPFSRRWTRSQNYYIKTAAAAPPPAAEAPPDGATAGSLPAVTERSNIHRPPSYVDQLLQMHQFELPLDLGRLHKFGGGASGAGRAFLARKQRQEAVFGARDEACNDLRGHSQALTINDYKRRMNIL